MSTIKEQVIDAYRRAGFDTMTACQFATEWLADLRKQPPGTVWHLGNARDGAVLAVRRD